METKENNNGEIIFLAPVVERYTFAKRFRGDKAREVYSAVAGRVAKDFKNLSAFNGYFKFNDETQEINGSDLYHGILINDELRASGLHLPSVVEGKSLDSTKRLNDGVYRDYGIAIYNDQDPNSETAGKLVKEVAKRGLKLPILIPFSALKLKRSGSDVLATLRDETLGIISGEEAQKYLTKQFDYKGNSGVRRLFHNRDGYWDAGWDYLGSSYVGGRVDWVCGEACQEDLIKAYDNFIHMRYDTKISRLGSERVLKVVEFLSFFEKMGNFSEI